VFKLNLSRNTQAIGHITVYNQYMLYIDASGLPTRPIVISGSNIIGHVLCYMQCGIKLCRKCFKLHQIQLSD
jgi:hypothetical protein